MPKSTQPPLNLSIASYIRRLQVDRYLVITSRFNNFKRRLKQPVEATLDYDNIYYCCTQKTASQWIKSVFQNLDFYRHSGFVVRPYIYLGLRYARVRRAFPEKTVVAHLYLNYQDYLRVPKPDKYKTFFVLRDPRDIIVSWYFSAKYSHGLIPPIHTMRYNLERLDFDDGLKYMIDTQAEFGLFECQRSWIEAQKTDSQIKIFRYEDLANDELSFVQNLFSFLELEIPNEKLNNIVTRNKVKNRSKDRKSLDGDKYNHYRKGISGDWQNHFNDSIEQYFYDVTGDLIEVLGY